MLSPNSNNNQNKLNSRDNVFSKPLIPKEERRETEPTEINLTPSSQTEPTDKPKAGSDLKQQPGKSKPDPAALAELFKQTADEERSKKPNFTQKIVMYVLIVNVIVLAVMIVWQFSLQNQIEELKTTVPVTIVPEENNSVSTEKKISIGTPLINAEVTGKIAVQASIDNITNVTLKVFDSNGVELASKVTDVTATNLSTTLDLVSSPSVPTGVLAVYATEDGLNSRTSVRVNVQFKQGIVVDRLTLLAPVAEQVVSNSKLKIIGELPDYSGETYSYILRGQSGGQIVSGQFNVKTNANEPATIDQLVEVGTLPPTAGDNGTLDIYMTDNAVTNVILTIPVRFSSSEK